ncbi:MAG: hypothetical protein ACI8PZ_005274 [Myxococcota bacterium]
MAWLTDERLRLYPGALFAAVTFAFVFTVLTADGARTVTGTLGGDYAAFHAVGSLLLDGRVDELYDWQVQAEAQRGLHPDDPNAFLSFAYPPFVALPYAALSLIGFRWGYFVHSVLAGLALWLGVWAVAPELPRVGRYRFALFVALLLFFPLFRAVPGGQNTAFSLCIVACTWRLLADGRDLPAGLVAGLLLYKPQLGIPLAGLLALRRRPAVVAGIAVSAVGLYAAGAALGGLGWPAWWWGQIAAFHAMDQDVNAPNSVGILGFLEAVLGPGQPAAVVPGLVLSGSLVLAMMALWWTDRVDRTTRWGLTAVALVLIPPHSMFYDAGLAALGLAVWADRARSPVWVVAVWFAALTTPISVVTGASPLFFVVVAIGAGVWLTAPGSPAPALSAHAPPTPGTADPAPP